MLNLENREKINYEILEPDVIKRDAIDAIEYEYKKRDISIVIENLEYTSVCPMTGLPDFGSLIIKYVPDKYIVELKSLKFYLLQYRNVGIFYEHLVNKILDDIDAIIKPRKIEVIGKFTNRGGIVSTVTAQKGNLST